MLIIYPNNLKLSVLKIRAKTCNLPILKMIKVVKSVYIFTTSFLYQTVAQINKKHNHNLYHVSLRVNKPPCIGPSRDHVPGIKDGTRYLAPYPVCHKRTGPGILSLEKRRDQTGLAIMALSMCRITYTVLIYNPMIWPRLWPRLIILYLSRLYTWSRDGPSTNPPFPLNIIFFIFRLYKFFKCVKFASLQVNNFRYEALLLIFF